MLIIVFNSKPIESMVSIIRKIITKIYLAPFVIQIQKENITHAYAHIIVNIVGIRSM